MLSNRKLIVIIGLIMVLFLSMACVSSADTLNTNQTIKADDSTDTAHDVPVDDKVLEKRDLTVENLKTEGQEYVYVNAKGNSSSNGSDISNPTTLSNSFRYIKNNGIIFLEDNDEWEYYDITSSLTINGLDSNVTSFTMTSSGKDNVVLRFNSIGTVKLSKNINITLSNITFTRSVSSTLPVIDNTANLILDNCYFHNINNTNRYGVIYTKNNLTIMNSRFLNNSALRQGGVAYGENTVINITNCVFENNLAENGAVISALNSSVYIADSSFMNNAASYGGVFSLRDDSNLVAEKSSFVNNTATSNGGVLDSWYSSSSFNNSLFANNSAYYGGVVYSVHNVKTVINSSLLEDNVASKQAGTVYAYGDNLTLTNNAILNKVKSRLIYLFNTTYDFDYNWWGCNNPDFSILLDGVLPCNWRLMTVDVPEMGKLRVCINKLSNSGTATYDLYERGVNFSTSATLEYYDAWITSTLVNGYSGLLDDLRVKIDNQSVGLNEKLSPYLNVANVFTHVNDTTDITVKCNPDITGTIEIKVNDTIIGSITPANGTGILTYIFNSSWIEGTYNITAVLKDDERYDDTTVSSALKLSRYDDAVLVNRHVEDRAEENITVSSAHELQEALQYQTSVKDQKSSGSCWAFSTLAALESSYLKVYGVEYDFSENNMKNVLKKYSTIGDVNSYPNDGANELEPIGYLIGWFGPVNESDDPYDEYSLMSPEINRALQVEDVYFIYRTSYNDTDNLKLKEAVLKYGAVSVSYYATGANGKNIYRNSSVQADHSVALVGWNDSYAKENYPSYLRPEGDGAYITKNSWGTSIGDGGYQYISYYDTSLGGVGLNSIWNSYSYAFPIQEYENYTNLYQHDTISTFITTLTPEAWVRNVYTAKHDESIGGIGTYFYEPTNYEAHVYVNDKLCYVQNGTIMQEGYRIIKLDKYVQVNEGDVFKVDLKLLAVIPPYTSITLQNPYLYKSISAPNRSFISIDGENWTDLYTSTDYQYSAACLKVYTKEVPTMNSTVDGYTVTTKVSKLNMPGKLSYKINDEYLSDDGEIVTVNVTENTTYTLTIPEDVVDDYKFNLTVILTTDNSGIYENISVELPLNLTINASNYTYHFDDEQTVHATVTIDDYENVKFNDGSILLVDNGEIVDESPIINGTADFKLNLSAGKYDYTLRFNGSAKHNCSDVTISIDILKYEVDIDILDIVNKTANGNAVICGVVRSQKGELLSNAKIRASINQKQYNVTSDENGTFTLKHFIDKEATYTVMLFYDETDNYYSTSKETSFRTDKQNTTITVDSIGRTHVGDNIIITGTLRDANNKTVQNATVTLYNNNEKIATITTNTIGSYNYEYTVYSNGTNMILVKYEGNETFTQSQANTSYDAKIIKNTTITINDVTGEYQSNTVINITVTLQSDEGKLNNTQIDVHLNDEIISLNTDENGTIEYSFTLTEETTVYARYNGDTEHYPSQTTTQEITIAKALETTLEVIMQTEITVNRTTPVTIIFVDENGNPVKNQEIIIITSTFNETVEIAYGVLVYRYTPTSVGEEEFTVTYNGNYKYNQTSTSATITVTEDKDKIIAELNGTIQEINRTCIVTIDTIPDIKFNDNLTVYGKLLDSKGTGIDNAEVRVNVNGVDNTVTTDAKGVWKLKIKTTTLGTNNVTASYSGTQYNPFTTSTSFEIAQTEAIITIDKIVTTQFRDYVTITGTFKNSNGKAIANSKVRVNVNGYSTYVTTDHDGAWSLTIKTNKTGVNNVTASFTGNANYAKYTANATFNVTKQDLIITTEVWYNQGNFTITGTFVDKNGNKLANSKIRVNINGKAVYVKTDSNGTYRYSEIITAKTIKYNVYYGGSANYNSYTSSKTTLTVA
ncbi:MAG: hypothetical protein BZ135_07035 [Methanosphaera sp. rholeuAM6]|nr:MAG: hypothetical protein BZ135_07035 [Methanosphaera sp. rholeuAM6]